MKSFIRHQSRYEYAQMFSTLILLIKKKENELIKQFNRNFRTRSFVSRSLNMCLLTYDLACVRLQNVWMFLIEWFVYLHIVLRCEGPDERMSTASPALPLHHTGLSQCKVWKHLRGLLQHKMTLPTRSAANTRKTHIYRRQPCRLATVHHSLLGTGMQSSCFGELISFEK